jgi:hypothetical protein
MSSPLSPRAGAHGALQLLTETDPASEMIRRAVRLEAASDGRSVLLVDTGSRRAGRQREVGYEITPAELIPAIRTQGADVSGHPRLAGRRTASAADANPGGHRIPSPGRSARRSRVVRESRQPEHATRVPDRPKGLHAFPADPAVGRIPHCHACARARVAQDARGARAVGRDDPA